MSDHVDEKPPQLEMMTYPKTKKLPTARHIRSLAVDFNENCVKLIDLAADKEDASQSVDLILIVSPGLTEPQAAVRRRIMFGKSRPIVHAKAKRAASAAGPKDVDADWEIINKEDLVVKEQEARSM